jgi:hypothetical protein
MANSPIFNAAQHRPYAAIFSFKAGVMPPMPRYPATVGLQTARGMFGRSLLYVLDSNTLFLGPFIQFFTGVFRARLRGKCSPGSFSEPSISPLIVPGFPRHSMMRFGLRMTRSTGRENRPQCPALCG